VAEQRVKDSTVSFKGIPKNALYKLEGKDSMSNRNRCFTYDEGKQNWY